MTTRPPRRRVTAALIVALCALPTSSAYWYTSGSFEPDTDEDVDDDLSWLSGDSSLGADRLYFNAVLTGSGFNRLSLNYFGVPHLGNGMLHSRFTGPGPHFSAYLGLWKDCDGDGYIGTAVGAAMTYPALLLDPDSPCQLLPNNQHVQDGIVYEFLWIVNSSVVSGPNYIQDPTARVWADKGRPGDDTYVPISDVLHALGSDAGETLWFSSTIKRNSDFVLESFPGIGGLDTDVAWKARGGYQRGEPDLVLFDEYGQPNGPVFFTFYAYSEFGRRPPATAQATYLYGSEWCMGSGTDVRRGFDCDPSHWWNPEWGGFSPAPPGAPRPGDAYVVRDVDCYDGRLVGTSWSEVFAEGSCRREI